MHPSDVSYAEGHSFSAPSGYATPNMIAAALSESQVDTSDIPSRGSGSYSNFAGLLSPPRQRLSRSGSSSDFSKDDGPLPSGSPTFSSMAEALARAAEEHASLEERQAEGASAPAERLLSTHASGRKPADEFLLDEKITQSELIRVDIPADVAKAHFRLFCKGQWRHH